MPFEIQGALATAKLLLVCAFVSPWSNTIFMNDNIYVLLFYTVSQKTRH